LDPSVGTAFPENLNGFVRFFSGVWPVALALEAFPVQEVVRSQIPSHAVLLVGIHGPLEPLFRLAQVGFTEV
jgi:hypothetical protein